MTNFKNTVVVRMYARMQKETVTESLLKEIIKEVFEMKDLEPRSFGNYMKDIDDLYRHYGMRPTIKIEELIPELRAL